MSFVGTVDRPPIVVVGSGGWTVIGLTTALVLARRGLSVHVVARDFPDDAEQSQDWSSPWAGANWCPFSTEPRVCSWETEGLNRLRELIPAGLAMELPIMRYASTEAGLHNHWYRDVAAPYRELDASECPADCVGVSFTSVSVNAPVYTHWLWQQCLALGVSRERKTLSSLNEATTSQTAVIVNASGLGAKTLRDVMDEAVEPIGGQVVLVRAPGITTSMMDGPRTGEPTRSTYVIPRPNSGGQVICGGCYQVGSTDRTVDPALADDILERCLEHMPQLRTLPLPGIKGIDVIRHCVGFRPSRRGGPRLEREWTEGGVALVHAYGIGPAGFQASWGMAKGAADLVGEALLTGPPPPDVASLKL